MTELINYKSYVKPATNPREVYGFTTNPRLVRGLSGTCLGLVSGETRQWSLTFSVCRRVARRAEINGRFR